MPLHNMDLSRKRLRKKFFDATLGNLRAADYALSSLFPTRMSQPDTSTPIDVAIPVIPKDLPTLPLCVAGLRQNIPHPIRNIYLIGPSKPEIIEAAQSLGLVFTDEDTILPGSPADIPIERTDRINRRGWIFQQFIKLSANVGSAPYTLFIDADHILIRPHTFLTDSGHTIFYTSREFYFPYYDNIRRLIGNCTFARHSFIAHKMLFNKQMLLRLQSILENRHGTDWRTAILNSLDWDYSSPFSEFELYPRTIPQNKRRQILWRQKALSALPSGIDYPETEAQALDVIHKLQLKYPEHLSITLPAYLRLPSS